MKIQDHGQFTVNTSMEKLLPFITDPEFMARALPDVREYKVDGPDSASLKMAVGVSHIRGVLPAKFKLERGEDGKLAVLANASGMGSRIDLRLDFTLTDRTSAVLVDWSSSADVNGTLASVGAGLLRPLARKQFDAVVTSVQTALANATA